MDDTPDPLQGVWLLFEAVLRHQSAQDERLCKLEADEPKVRALLRERLIKVEGELADLKDSVQLLRGAEHRSEQQAALDGWNAEVERQRAPRPSPQDYRRAYAVASAGCLWFVANGHKDCRTAVADQPEHHAVCTACARGGG